MSNILKTPSPAEIIASNIEAGATKLIISGPAGSGKTTLVKELLKNKNRKYKLLAPTGKAAVRLKEVTGHLANTIHSALYPGAIEDEEGNLVWVDPISICNSGEVVIIDEASMVGKKIYQDIYDKLPRGSSVIFVGDPFQLPPVNEEPGVDLNKPTVYLSEVHRQSEDNIVLALATATREVEWIPFLNEYQEDKKELQLFHGHEPMVANLVNEIKTKQDTIGLCFTNPTRSRINREIRSALGYSKPIEINDRLIVKTNNKAVGLMNGEIFEVEKVRYYTHKMYGRYGIVRFKGKKTPYRVSLSHIGCSRSDWWNFVKLHKKFPRNYIHVDYGYAITVHSSQGSEWENVHYYWEPAQTNLMNYDFESAKSMFYTGITRTYKNLKLYR